MENRLSETKQQTRLKESGWKMIDEYVNNHTKARFQCLKCNDIVTSTFAKVATGHKKCLCHKKIEFELKKYLQWANEAKNRGGKLVTPSYIGYRKTHYLWECASGHRWESSPQSVVEQKSWCPTCAGNKPRLFEELDSVAKKRGGKLLSTEYRGTEHHVYKFECSRGHVFENRFRHIVDRGQWCPICSKGTKSEELVRTTLEQIFQVRFRKYRPKWLRNSRNRQMELDGYNEELKLAFEYQGIQHFENVSIFSSDRNMSSSEKQERLKLRIEDDQRKIELCKEHGVKLVVLSYCDKLEQFSREIRKQVVALGMDIDGYDFDQVIDYSGAYIRDDRLEELREILSKKNILLLSNKWISTDTKYELKCEVCNHQWTARGNSFFNSRRVSGCKKCTMNALLNNQKLHMNVLIEYAEKFEGTVLSNEYVRRNHVYEFKCKEGHVFKSNFNNMVYRNQFCPICEGRQIRNRKSETEQK